MVSEPTNPATLYVRGLNDPDGEWREVGTVTNYVVQGTKLLEAAQSFEQAMLKLGNTFKLSFTGSVMPGYFAELQRRLAVLHDPCRCNTCRRRFRGVWQRRKHERTAHA